MEINPSPFCERPQGGWGLFFVSLGTRKMDLKNPTPSPASKAQDKFDQSLGESSLERQLALVRALLNNDDPKDDRRKS